MRVCVSAPDEAAEQTGGVADDACSTGLLVLTALQGQTVVHVTFRVKTGLETQGREQVGRETEDRERRDIRQLDIMGDQIH